MLLNYINHITHTDLELIKLNSQINWLNIIALLVCVILIISAKLISSESILSIIGLKKEKTLTAKGLPSYFLSLNYFIVLALFLWNYYSITTNTKEIYSLFIIFAIIIGVSFLKIFAIYSIDVLFRRKKHFHLKLHFQFYQLIGVILLPLYVLTYFLESEHLITSYYYILILSILLLIIRETLSLFTALNNRISLLYLILYLCTLELLPIALVIKFFM